ncbi:STY0301 family protein [Burkholderia dolosa]|uniref:STY0301 family protein n=1 Tax=Burkholderia dolosa TaxID=152500 RepID=UPI001BACEF16|nr:STY0301 family protein [Burkholderia dolosa]
MANFFFPLNAALAAVLASAACVSSARATSTPIQCPTRLPVSQTVDTPAPTGWTPYGSQKAHPLVNVSFWSGPPDGLTMLAPTRGFRQRSTLIDTWSLAAADTDYWVSCQYFNTAAIIARPLGTAARTCTVRYDGKRTPPTMIDWHCTPPAR